MALGSFLFTPHWFSWNQETCVPFFPPQRAWKGGRALRRAGRPTMCSGRVSLANEGGPSLLLLTQAGDRADWMPRTPQGLRMLVLLSAFFLLSSPELSAPLPLLQGGSSGPHAFWTPSPAMPPQPFSSTSRLIFSQFSALTFSLLSSPQYQKHFTPSLPL